MLSLDGRVAWITGAGSGIGRAGAIELARAGVVTILSGRRLAELEQVASTIRKAGGKADVEPLDVGDRAATIAVGKSILDRHGRCDILVNSAGINTPRRYWKELDPENFAQVVNINLNGTLNSIAAILPAMRARKDGLVINIASWAGKYDTYLTGPAYSASKHAVVSLSASLNMEECINGIRSTCISPGEVATPILDRRPVPPSPEERARMLQEEDLGRTIRFVAELPARACVNEIVISPTWNRFYVGGDDIKRS